MKSYPAYRNIGLDFLDSIPTDWEVARLKHLSSVNFSNVDKHIFEEEIPVRLCNYVNVYKNDLITPDMAFMKASATEAEIKKFILRKGDVLITKDSESWEDIAVPAYVTNDMDGVLCGYHLAQIRSTGIDGKFLFWTLCSSTLNDQYKVEAHGITRYGLGKDSIENSVIPVPSLSEQQTIAHFLDCKTAQIDTLIEKKQRQIDLLQEQRAALINHTVTKGLNPDMPMKDSGVEWLGEIPSHWDMIRLRHISPNISVGLVIQPTQYIDPEGTVPFLYGSNIRENSFLLDDVRKISPESSLKLNTSMLHAGDLVTVRVGYPGVTAVIPPFLEGANCASMMIVRKSDFVLSEYLCYTMNSRVGMIQIGAVQYGAAQKQFNISHAVDFIYPIPPAEEQESIVDYLEGKSQGIYRLISLIQKQIERLQEYRTALISEAVTGKIDVR